MPFLISKEIKEKAEKFGQDWKDDKRKMLQSVVDLEKASMNKGCNLAISFVSGHARAVNFAIKATHKQKFVRTPTWHAGLKMQLELL